MISPEPYLDENPQYVIVFRAPSPENAALLADVLGTDLDTDVDAGFEGRVGARSSRTVLRSRNGVHARVYTRLAVAVANLSPQQLRAVEALPEVARVARNLPRTLPPVYRGTLSEDSSAEPGPWNRALEQIGLGPGYAGPTGRGVKVAVLDTGLDLSHPDFRVLPGNAKSFVSDEPDADDGNGHGTHCAGVIAGRADTAAGLRYAVAPDAELLIGKVLNRFGRGFDDAILDGIDWAADMGAEVISLSLGSLRAVGQPFSAPYEAVAAALLAQGVLLVAAAGNDSRRPTYVAPVNNPAACPSILAVAAIDGRDRVASFSCGTVDAVGAVDVAAPGVGILSAWPGGFERLSGTSMATPHVAGIATLFRERFPDDSGEALWARLLAAVRPLSLPSEDVGAGVAQVP